jgi:hypothetical protein
LPTKEDFEKAAKIAIKNVVAHGDTDIFPFPFERFVLQDKEAEVVALLHHYNENFDEYLARYSPSNVILPQ